MREFFLQPLLPASDVTESLSFYQALGFETLRNEAFPYRFAEVRDGELMLLLSNLAQYGGKKSFGAFIVTVEDVAGHHERFAGHLLLSLGAVPLRGKPRITRLSIDGGQFRVFDPAGNMLVYMDRTYRPPAWIDPDNAAEAALKHAWFNRDIYANDAAAANVLDRAIDKVPEGDVRDRARLLAARAEVAVAMGDEAVAAAAEQTIADLSLSEEERVDLHEELTAASRLRNWIK